MKQLIARRENVAVLIIFILLASTLAGLKIVKVRDIRGDTAIFSQVTENIAYRGAPVSQVFASTQGYLDSHLLSASAQQIAEDPLAPPAEKERNMLRFHENLILFVIAPLVWLFPSIDVLLTLQVVGYVGVVLLAYFGLRQKSVPMAAAVLFCFLIVSHPAWSQSLLTGQFHPDRLFVLAGFAFMYLVSRQSTSRAALAAAAIICMLIDERAALTAGLFILLYVALHWRKERLDPYFKIGLGAALLLYAAVIFKLVLANPEYSSFLPGSVGDAIAEMHNPTFAQEAGLYMLVNAPFLLLALFNVRAAVIAFVLMLPNIFGNIGGAEKIGWPSHYHTYDLPVVIWASLIGYETAYRIMAARSRQAVYSFYGLIGILVLFVNFLDPQSFAPIAFAPANVSNNFVVRFEQQAVQYLSPAGLQDYAAADRIRQAIPEHTVVSTVDDAMTLLYHNREMQILPIDIDRADYAVILFDRRPNKSVLYFGVDSNLGPNEQKKINEVIVNRMKRDGYDFRHAQLFPLGVAVIKRQAP